MVTRQVTIEDRLDVKSDFCQYLMSAIGDFSSIKRLMFQYMKKPDFCEKFLKSSNFISFIVSKFQIHSRAVNSLYREIDGEMKAYKALKKVELKQTEAKLSVLENQKEKLKDEIDKLRKLSAENKLNEKQLRKYRRKKSSYYWKCNRINRIKNRISKLQYIIENNIYNICFGSKKMFDKQHRLKENGYSSHEEWYQDFVKNRDKEMFFIGSSNEFLGNHLILLKYNPETDSYEIGLRKISTKEIKRCDHGDPNAYVFYKGLKFKHWNDKIVEILKNHVENQQLKQAISYRFLRRHYKWYVQLVFEARFEEKDYTTFDSFGVIGLDFNNGFIQMSETNASGNLINLQKFTLKYHGSGNKAKTEIEQVINKIVKYAKLQGKDIVFEDLDFKKSKARQIKANGKSGKKYNKMLHALNYSRFIKKLNDICFNQNVNLHKVNPAYTSKIGVQKFSKRMKISAHQAAAFVIARKYQGFRDSYVKRTKTA